MGELKKFECHGCSFLVLGATPSYSATNDSHEVLSFGADLPRARWVRHGLNFCRLTLELNGPPRQAGLARLAKMYKVPRTGPSLPAVEGPFERKVSRQ